MNLIEKFPSGKVMLTREFFDLGLAAKHLAIAQIEASGILDLYPHLIESIANALLQHSADKISKDYPVRGLGNQTRKSKIADVQKLLEPVEGMLGDVTTLGELV